MLSDDWSSQWIHRDKLLQIEQEEIKAASELSIHSDHQDHQPEVAESSRGPTKKRQLCSNSSRLPLPKNKVGSLNDGQHLEAEVEDTAYSGIESVKSHASAISLNPDNSQRPESELAQEETQSSLSQSHPHSNRNGTSQNSRNRLRSSHGARNPVDRPLGEPPWYADMYKPDPMLPQDQQLVPTHAKRLRQLKAGHQQANIEDVNKPDWPLAEDNIRNTTGDMSPEQPTEPRAQIKSCGNYSTMPKIGLASRRTFGPTTDSLNVNPQSTQTGRSAPDSGSSRSDKPRTEDGPSSNRRKPSCCNIM